MKPRYPAGSKMFRLFSDGEGMPHPFIFPKIWKVFLPNLYKALIFNNIFEQKKYFVTISTLFRTNPGRTSYYINDSYLFNSHR